VKVINAVTDDLKREQVASVGQAAEVAGDNKLSPEEKAKKLKEIFGIA
jgi:hypothetical protein